ncbi:hypothetical protein DB30_00300 [Enhygromyxa salina]|uniref:Uncharacterized protein n=1 Tax=Enhygromyxa salina TaxID=215803 RepID=A0A0C2DAS9_9BACT|nr:hypothetical protein DB30_00300 [Enhygromyxa salina]
MFGTMSRVADRYSEGSFSIMCEDGPLPVVLHSTTDRRTSASHVFDLVPAWLLPLVNPDHERAYTASVLGNWVTLPTHPRMSAEQADAIRTLALAEVEASKLVVNGSNDRVVVTETIMDFEQLWVCEGPRREVSGARMIVAPKSGGIGLAANHVKFAPAAELHAITRRVALRELGVVLVLDAVALLVAILVGLKTIL